MYGAMVDGILVYGGNKMKPIEALKSRLINNSILEIQNENGFVGKMGFEWNQPATDIEITEFEK